MVAAAWIDIEPRNLTFFQKKGARNIIPPYVSIIETILWFSIFMRKFFCESLYGQSHKDELHDDLPRTPSQSTTPLATTSRCIISLCIGSRRRSALPFHDDRVQAA